MPQQHAFVSDIRQVTPNVLEVVLKRTNATPFANFRAGQYATLSFPGHPYLKGERSFSIASSPTRRNTLRFGIRVGGRYTSTLKTLRPGSPAMVAGPYGDFTFDHVNDKSAVFIAGGIGITPFLSMMRGATDRQLSNDLTLIYSVRSLADAPFAAEIDALEAANPHLHVVYAISDGKVPDKTNRLFPGRVTSKLIDWAVGGSPWGRTYFLCGPPPFMKAMTKQLKEIGIEPKAVLTERFAVGDSSLIERGSPMPKLVFAAWGTAAAIILTTIAHVEQGKRAAALTSTAAVVPISSTPDMLSPTNTPTNTDTALPSTPVDQPIVQTPVATSPTPTYTAPVYTPPVYHYMPRTAVS